MTRSEFVRSQIKPLIEVLKPFINPEDDPKSLERKVELWALRLIIDVDSCDLDNDGRKYDDLS